MVEVYSNEDLSLQLESEFLIQLENKVLFPKHTVSVSYFWIYNVDFDFSYHWSQKQKTAWKLHEIPTKQAVETNENSS